MPKFTVTEQATEIFTIEVDEAEWAACDGDEDKEYALLEQYRVNDDRKHAYYAVNDVDYMEEL